MSGLPPKRDKFAALAAHQQQAFLPSQQQSESTANPTNASGEAGSGALALATPKRDKFASMAASLQQQGNNTSPSQIVISATSPTQISSTPADFSNATIATLVKRDKFASLAAKQGASFTTTTDSPTVSITTAPKRDKAASLAAVNSGVNLPKRDKFASMAAAATDLATKKANVNEDIARMKQNLAAEAAEKERLERKYQEMLQRCHQRDSIWKDLDLAEAKTIQLLQLAEKTAIQLGEKALSITESNDTNIAANVSASRSSATDVVNMEDLQKIATQYQSTVADINRLLKPHAALVLPYQVPTRVNRMYQKRVELRIAASKRSLAQDYLKLQQEEFAHSESSTFSEISKNRNNHPQDEDANKINTNFDSSGQVNTDTADHGTKRKREEQNVVTIV